MKNIICVGWLCMIHLIMSAQNIVFQKDSSAINSKIEDEQRSSEMNISENSPNYHCGIITDKGLLLNGKLASITRQTKGNKSNVIPILTNKFLNQMVLLKGILSEDSIGLHLGDVSEMYIFYPQKEIITYLEIDVELFSNALKYFFGCDTDLRRKQWFSGYFGNDSIFQSGEQKFYIEYHSCETEKICRITEKPGVWVIVNGTLVLNKGNYNVPLKIISQKHLSIHQNELAEFIHQLFQNKILLSSENLSTILTKNLLE